MAAGVYFDESFDEIDFDEIDFCERMCRLIAKTSMLHCHFISNEIRLHDYGLSDEDWFLLKKLSAERCAIADTKLFPDILRKYINKTDTKINELKQITDDGNEYKSLSQSHENLYLIAADMLHDISTVITIIYRIKDDYMIQIHEYLRNIINDFKTLFNSLKTLIPKSHEEISKANTRECYRDKSDDLYRWPNGQKMELLLSNLCNIAEEFNSRARYLLSTNIVETKHQKSWELYVSTNDFYHQLFNAIDHYKESDFDWTTIKPSISHIDNLLIQIEEQLKKD